MIKRICDCCEEEVTKDFIKFYITWNRADAVNGESDKEKPRDTPYFEYCDCCFNNVLDKLGLDKV